MISAFANYLGFCPFRFKPLLRTICLKGGDIMSIAVAGFVIACIGVTIACISFGYQLGKDISKNQK